MYVKLALWQQATVELTRRDHSIIACSSHVYGVFLRAHSVRGEPRISAQRQGSGCNNTTHILQELKTNAHVSTFLIQVSGKFFWVSFAYDFIMNKKDCYDNKISVCCNLSIPAISRLGFASITLR